MTKVLLLGGHGKVSLLLTPKLLARSWRSKAPWWDEESWGLVQKMNKEVMPVYYKAKLAADEVLTVKGRERKDFEWIVLRPGALSDEPESGQVQIGKTVAKGSVPRGDVAEVAVRLLEREGVSGWFDLLGGDKSTSDEVERVLSSGEDSIEGEDLRVMMDDIEKYE